MNLAALCWTWLRPPCRARRALREGQDAVYQTQARAGCSGESAVDGPSCGSGDGGGELDGRDAPWVDAVRLRLNCGPSSPEMWLTLLGRTTETMEVPSAEVEGPWGGKVNSFIVLTFS